MPPPSPPLALTRRTCATRSEPAGKSSTRDRACSPGAACRLCVALQRTAQNTWAGSHERTVTGCIHGPFGKDSVLGVAPHFWLRTPQRELLSDYMNEEADSWLQHDLSSCVKPLVSCPLCLTYLSPAEIGPVYQVRD